MGQAFEQQQKVMIYRQTSRIQQKGDIMKKAAKIGVVHIKDSLTGIWKKYIAVMSENYIYLYNDKKDQTYRAYYYIKNAVVE